MNHIDARILVLVMKRHDAQKRMRETKGIDDEENQNAFRIYRSYDSLLSKACDEKLKPIKPT